MGPMHFYNFVGVNFLWVSIENLLGILYVQKWRPLQKAEKDGRNGERGCVELELHRRQRL